MSNPQETPMRELIERWRKADPDDAGDFMRQECADELEAALAQMKPVAEVRVVDGITSVHGQMLLELPDGTKLYTLGSPKESGAQES